MSDASWADLSDQAVTVAGVVYFLALLVHLAEWASLRQPAAAEAQTGAGGAVLTKTGPEAAGGDSGRSARVAFLGRLGILLTVIACGVHFVGLLSRGMAADPNRVPWSNMYEFTVSGTFVLTLMYLVLLRRFQLEWLAPIVVGFVTATLMVAMIWLHGDIGPLPDSLDSYWLVIHVVSAITATGAFTLGGILSVMYLVKARSLAKGRAHATGPMARVPELNVLDRTAYRVHAFAFPVWTFAVLITGPIWAHEAWSRYWNWDPKEVWAFITWVVYAAYLHARATAGWKGRNAAILACVGMATLWFNFIGINYFSSSSMHSYAEIAVPLLR